MTLSVTTTVKAKAYHPEWTTSATATATYTIKVAEPPTIDLPSGEYPLGQAVTLTSAAGTSILYTLDGSSPTTSSLSVPSGATLYLMRAMTLKAVAFKTDCELSDAATESYTVTGTAPAVTLSGGASHSLLTKPDGTVWAWGLNSNGQLGDGTLTQRLQPVPLSSPGSVVSLDGGTGHGVAVTSENEVWSWGYRYYGQLGDGSTTTQNPTPTRLASPTGAVAASAGQYHTIAVTSDTHVWAWGRNNVGQLGNGVTTPEKNPTPALVPGFSGAVAVSAGTAHSLAVKTDGSVWAWGSNTYGLLGRRFDHGSAVNGRAGQHRCRHRERRRRLPPQPGAPPERRRCLGLGLQREWPARRRYQLEPQDTRAGCRPHGQRCRRRR